MITAITGLIVALHQIGTLSSSPSAKSPAVTSTPVTTEPDTTSAPPEATTAAAYRATFPAGKEATVAGSVYRIRGARLEHYNPGELSMKLSVRFTNNGPYPANFWDASFRLLVNGVPRAPIGGLDAVVEGRSAADGIVQFVVPTAARRMTLLVGDKPENTVRLPVRLAPKG